MSAAPDLALHLVPVTPAVAALLHQLQQEVAEAQCTPEPGSVVLLPSGPKRLVQGISDDTYLRSYSDDYNAGAYLAKVWTSSWYTWSGEEERRDVLGRRWARRLTAVVDDFGDVVEVSL